MLVPSAPPSNVTGRSKSSTSIFVQWDQVPVADQNGVILSYTVTYIAFTGGSSQTKTVTAPANQTTLISLNEYTNYSITVFASTSKGGGNQSTPIVVITDEDSKFMIAGFFLLFSCLVFHLACVLCRQYRQFGRCLQGNAMIIMSYQVILLY